MKIDLTGQIAVVTGASRGIGAATARALAACGAHVVLNCRDSRTRVAALVDELAAAGFSAEALVFDVADEAGVKDSMQDIARRHGRIDILVNNAGRSHDALMLRVRSEDFDSMVQTNLKGTFLCTFHAARYMLKQRRGRIVNLSSIVGLGGNAGQSVYALTKAGIVGLTKSLAKELGPRGILVNAVAPGLIDTDMTAGMEQDQMGTRIPLGRIGRPEDVAGVVVFLCSELSAYMTGEVLVVDGGLYA